MSNGYLKKQDEKQKTAFLAGLKAGTYGNGYKDGFVGGQRFQGMVYLLAMDNVYGDADMEPPKEFYRQVETEAQRIMDEIEVEAKDDAEYAFDILAGHVNEIRVKNGMPPLDWWDKNLDRIMLKTKEKESATP